MGRSKYSWDADNWDSEENFDNFEQFGRKQKFSDDEAEKKKGNFKKQRIAKQKAKGDIDDDKD